MLKELDLGLKNKERERCNCYLGIILIGSDVIDMLRCDAKDKSVLFIVKVDS